SFHTMSTPTPVTTTNQQRTMMMVTAGIFVLTGIMLYLHYKEITVCDLIGGCFGNKQQAGRSRRHHDNNDSTSNGSSSSRSKKRKHKKKKKKRKEVPSPIPDEESGPVSLQSDRIEELDVEMHDAHSGSATTSSASSVSNMQHNASTSVNSSPTTPRISTPAPPLRKTKRDTDRSSSMQKQ
uniref:A20-type domain-containing protein n=1 Tax=Haemonchus contortus TaxID=6289 RepID=A0A7I4XUB5_HAECO